MGSVATMMGRWLLFLSFLVGSGCASSRACVETAQLHERIASLAAMNWRSTGIEITDQWHASADPNAPDMQILQFQHVAEQASDGYCLCCETLVFSRGLGGTLHLEAIGIIRTASSRNDAMAQANAIVSATRAGATQRLTDQNLSGSFSWTDAELDTILDAKVFSRSGDWLLNVYWARYYKGE